MIDCKTSPYPFIIYQDRSCKIDISNTFKRWRSNWRSGSAACNLAVEDKFINIKTQIIEFEVYAGPDMPFLVDIEVIGIKKTNVCSA
jgi:hypothetical protein